MEQAVTRIEGSITNSYGLFKSEFGIVEEHLAKMTGEGWRLVSTQMVQGLTTTPMMFFWRREQ